MVTAMYPGSFDPVTLGHVDIATRAATLFSKVFVAVYSESSKEILFSTEQRADYFRNAVGHLPNVEVVEFHGLVVESARRLGANAIVRGLRSGSDFEYEFEMAYMNRKLDPDIEVVCLMSSLRYQYVSSSLLKEVVGLGGDVSGLIPSEVMNALESKLRPAS